MKNLIIYSTELEQENKLNTIDNLHHVSITDEDPVTPNYDPIIRFEDPICKQVMVEAFGNKDIKGEITYREAANVTNEEWANAFPAQQLNPNNGYKSSNLRNKLSTIKYFNEFQYFIGLTQIGNILENNKGAIGVTKKTSNNLAFNQSDLIEITLPKNLKILGNYCFNQCKNLKTIKFNSKINTIGIQCFNGCNSNFVNLDLSECEYIYYSGFYNCTGLVEIDLLSLKWLDEKAFYRYPYEGATLKHIKNFSLRYIPRYCFLGQLQLEEVDLFNVEYINNWGLYNCSNLNNINNFNNLVILGQHAMHIDARGLKVRTNQLNITNFPKLKMIQSGALQNFYPENTTLELNQDIAITHQYSKLNYNNPNHITQLHSEPYKGLSYYLGENNINDVEITTPMEYAELLTNGMSFYNYKNLEKIILTNVQKVMSYAFDTLPKLKEIRFNNSFEDIKWYSKTFEILYKTPKDVKVYFNNIEATPEQYEYLFTGSTSKLKSTTNIYTQWDIYLDFGISQKFINYIKQK